jgi:dTDP-4-dehydrorhamnose reductase
MSKILILGSTGMLGKMVYSYLTENTSYNILSTEKEVNYSNLNSINFNVRADSLEKILKNFNPDVLVNCIGLIKPNINEEDNSSINDAFLINSYFPLLISKLSNKYKYKYIQIGTDCVFSGDLGSYVETSYPDAKDIYGKSKIAGEILTQNKLLIRSSIVGPERGDGRSLLNWIIHNKNKKIFGYKDHLWNGITTLNFAKIVLGIINNESYDISLQHLIPKDIVTKYELLIYFKKYFNLNVDVEKTDSGIYIDRTLSTINKNNNSLLWNNAGYQNVPTIEENIYELSKSKITQGILST